MVNYTLLAGPLNGIALKLFPSLEPMNNEQLFMGLVTAENRGSFRVFVLYLVMGAAITALFIELLLLIDDMTSFVAVALIVLSGAASKVLIGFSPTVYASSDRTSMVMSCCILAAGVQVYSRNIQRQEISLQFQGYILGLMDILMAVSFVNLAFLAGTAFR